MLAHSRQHPFHPAHHFAHAALAEHVHHLLRQFKLIQQLVDVQGEAGIAWAICIV